jgi:hypothetical protein
MDDSCVHADDPSDLAPHLYTILYRVAQVVGRSQPQSKRDFGYYPEVGHELTMSSS